MNYIGSKHSLLPFLEEVYHSIAGGNEKVFCDLFAGTGAVGRLFKRLGLQVIANDLQYYAYVLNKAYLEINEPPAFSELRKRYVRESNPLQSPDPVQEALSFFNALSSKSGFIARHYSPDGNR